MGLRVTTPEDRHGDRAGERTAPPISVGWLTQEADCRPAARCGRARHRSSGRPAPEILVAPNPSSRVVRRHRAPRRDCPQDTVVLCQRRLRPQNNPVMNPVRRPSFISSLFAFMLLLSLEAGAQTAFTTNDVNVRAGPDRVFPMVGWLPRGTSVRVFGCTSGWRWCDVAARRSRGWVHSSFLSNVGRGRIPIVAFSVGPYWNSHYRGRPWYPSQSQWMSWGTPGFWPPPPPPGRRAW